MNENFGFLASEMREKSVYCDNGETISDAINAGYNSLTIYGSCSGAVGVYRMDPSPFGISYSDMPNKPTSFLLIQGGTGDGSDSITAPTSSNFKFIVGNNAFVQLHNLTLNSEVYIDDGSSVRFETVTINGHIEANNNSTALLKNSTLNGTTDNPPLRVKANGHAEVENTDINGLSTGYEAIWLWNNASLMLQGTSTVSAPSGSTGLYVSLNSSVVIQDDVVITSVDRNAISIDKNSSVGIKNNVNISRTDDSSNTEIYLDPTSALSINGDSITIGDVGCEGITSYVKNDGNTSVNISSTCNGYQNLMPNFIKITSGNCESNGYNNLLSPHECAQATNKIVTIENETSYPSGCQLTNQSTILRFNTQNNTRTMDTDAEITEMWCKQ